MPREHRVLDARTGVLDVFLFTAEEEIAADKHDADVQASSDARELASAEKVAATARILSKLGLSPADFEDLKTALKEGPTSFVASRAGTGGVASAFTE